VSFVNNLFKSNIYIYVCMYVYLNCPLQSVSVLWVRISQVINKESKLIWVKLCPPATLTGYKGVLVPQNMNLFVNWVSCRCLWSDVVPTGVGRGPNPVWVVSLQDSMWVRDSTLGHVPMSTKANMEWGSGQPRTPRVSAGRGWEDPQASDGAWPAGPGHQTSGL
jgi:hypothetical protein